MQTPKKVTLKQFADMRNEWIRENSETDGEYQKCKTCGTLIKILGAYMSIHDSRFSPDCAGSGRVMRLVIPYCPQCELKPEEQGCIHELEPWWDGLGHLPSAVH